MLSYNTSTNYFPEYCTLYSTHMNHALCWVTDAAGKAISYYMRVITLALVFHHGHLLLYCLRNTQFWGVFPTLAVHYAVVFTSSTLHS